MPNYLSGYYLRFPATRLVMKNLQIDDKGVENWRIEFPINDWLAKQGKKDILAGVLQHPSTGRDAREDEDHGLFLVTQIHSSGRSRDKVSFKEGEKEKRVKEWLINDGSDLEWMPSVFDNDQITCCGFVPTSGQGQARPDDACSAYEMDSCWCPEFSRVFGGRGSSVASSLNMHEVSLYLLYYLLVVV